MFYPHMSEFIHNHDDHDELKLKKKKNDNCDSAESKVSDSERSDAQQTKSKMCILSCYSIYHNLVI